VIYFVRRPSRPASIAPSARRPCCGRSTWTADAGPGLGARTDIPRRRPVHAADGRPAPRYAAMMADIDVPVLLIGGDVDRLVPVTAMRQAATRNPHWESVIFAGVGHTPQLEVPGAVAGAIRNWLDRHIEYHVRELALPRPGSDAQLTEQVSRLHARPLDRGRPLWEVYLITALAG
jgi:pimeloyl-ACP methyl ester carboxylesterase